MELILEIVASFGAIYGSAMMLRAVSVASEQKDNIILTGYWGYMIANFAIMYLSVIAAANAMFTQTLLFTGLSAAGIFIHSKNRARHLLMISPVLALAATYLPLMLTNPATLFFSENLDSYAAPLAMLGGLILLSREQDVKKYAFMLFVMADLIYVAFSVQQGWFVLGAQYLVFIYLSAKAVLHIDRQQILSLRGGA